MALYDEAVGLLRALGDDGGIRASATAAANYRAVFARDAVMAGIAGLLVSDEGVTAALVRTLEHLRDLQGPEGQIPSNYEPRADGPTRVSFGTLVPRPDATSWYLIGVALGARAAALDASPFAQSAHRAVRLLDALEYNGRHLLYMPAGGNWADEYVHDGYILHDQVLRAWALRLAGEVFAERAWRDKADRIDEAVSTAFWPRGDGVRRFPLAAVSPIRVHDAFDLATCSLLALTGSAPPGEQNGIEWIAERYLARGELPPAFAPVIAEGHPDWPALQRYHLHGFRNRPHEYHNGGVWMIWLGWLALALARTGRVDDLERLRRLVTDRIARTDCAYDFEEFLHGLTGAPGGMARMAYSATGIVMLHAAGSAAQRRLLGP